MNKNEQLKFLDEFKVDECEYIFRFQKMQTEKMLAIIQNSNKKDFNQVSELFSFILNYVEIKLENQWVKLKQGEQFFPPALEYDLKTLFQIVNVFALQVIAPLF